jgi:rhodanese-related sulfurtransferase
VKSVKAARLAADMGYTQVMVFRGGIPAWVKAGNKLAKTASYAAGSIPAITPSGLAEKLKAGAKLYLLDIRGPGMFKKAHLKGAVNLPLYVLDQKLSELPRDRPVVLIDHAGKQTLVCGRFLKSKGWNKAARLEGGVMAWIRKGLPVTK